MCSPGAELKSSDIVQLQVPLNASIKRRYSSANLVSGSAIHRSMRCPGGISIFLSAVVVAVRFIKRLDRNLKYMRHCYIVGTDSYLNPLSRGEFLVNQVKSVWRSLNVSLGLVRPVLDEWHRVPGRFFTMIYDTLAGVVPVNSREFSVISANQLSEVRARYAIYGGASSVSITPDALMFDFPGLLPGDGPIVQQILARLHDAFLTAFPELRCETTNVQSSEHLEFINERMNPTDYLKRFMFPNEATRIDKEQFLLQPGGKCEIVAQDQSWRCNLAVERSLPNARAVFVAITYSLYKVDPTSPYLTKAERARSIVDLCYRLLELETTNATG
jgi:hypothetical protein